MKEASTALMTAALLAGSVPVTAPQERKAPGVSRKEFEQRKRRRRKNRAAKKSRRRNRK